MAQDFRNILQDDLQTFVFSLTLLFPVFNFFILHDIVTRQFSFRNYQEDLHLASVIILLTLFFWHILIS